MIKRQITILAIILVLSVAVIAQTDIAPTRVEEMKFIPSNETIPGGTPVLINEPEDDIETAVKGFNENIGTFPDIITGLIGDEHIHVFYTNSDGETIEYGAITEEGLIVDSIDWIDEDNDEHQDVWMEEGTKTTMKLYFDERAIERLATSESPVDDFKDMWGNEIRIEGISFGAKIKNLFANIGLWIASLFAD